MRTLDAYHTLHDLYLAMGRPDDAQRIYANIRATIRANIRANIRE